MLKSRSFVFCLLLACVVFSLASCDSSPTTINKIDSTSVVNAPTSDATTATPSPSPSPTPSVAMPATETSCPTSGTVRPAVIVPLALGSNQNLVYSYKTDDGTHLRRYNMATAQKTDIVTLPYAIDYPQISSDGQWILFLGKISQYDERLELVRMDGQGLQTLYCFAQNQIVLSLQWSPDQKLVAYGVQVGPSNDDSIGLLSILSGTQKMLFQATNIDFYGRIAWLDNTHLYVDKEVRADSSPGTLYLMDVTTASLNSPGFQTLLNYTANVGLISYKGDAASNKLYFAYCNQRATPVATTISVYAANGGAKQTQFQVNGCVSLLEALSADSLFLLYMNPTSNGTISLVHTDGSSLSTLTKLPAVACQQPSRFTNQFEYVLHSSADRVNEVGQSPWFNFSRDGSTYALEGNTYGCASNSGTSAIVIGSLNSGNSTPIATAEGGTVHVVGWTTM